MVGYFSDEPGSQELTKGLRELSAGKPAGLANLDGKCRGDFLLVMHRKSSAFLAQRISAGAQGQLPVVTMQDPRPEKWGRRLATFLVPTTSNFDRSDHVPFWKRGIPAIMLCDTAHLRTKNYHRPTDTLDYERTAAVADAVAHLVTATTRLGADAEPSEDVDEQASSRCEPVSMGAPPPAGQEGLLPRRPRFGRRADVLHRAAG